MLAPTTTSLASSRHLLSEAQHLVKRGVDISFLVPHHYYLPFEKTGYIKNEIIDGVKIKHVYIPVRYRSATRIDLSPIGYWTWKLVCRALEETFDLIHVMKPYYTSASTGLILHMLTGKPIVLECDDLEGKEGWGGSLAGEPLFGFKVRLINKYERLLPLLADAVIANTRALHNMLKLYGVEEHRMAYIPYSVDEYMTKTGDRDKTRRKIGLKDEPVAIYCGALHPHHYDCDLLITAMQIVHKKIPGAKMIIVGDGGARRGLESMAEKLDLLNSKIIFSGWAPRQEIPNYIAAADIGVVPMRNTSASRARGLSKVLEYLCQSRPVVMAGIGQAEELTDGGKAAFLIEPDTPSALADGIITAFRNPGLCREKGLHGRRYVKDKFSGERAADRVLEIYRSVIKN